MAWPLAQPTSSITWNQTLAKTPPTARQLSAPAVGCDVGVAVAVTVEAIVPVGSGEVGVARGVSVGCAVLVAVAPG